GIGRSLSHATAAIAGENGVQRIRAVIQRSNEDAIHYYRSVGFHDDTANMTSSSVTLIRPTAPGGR
ncbi:GNAT family N-acetyltransferase, partial [Xanthomonas citri pv. citri]|nr:GNAT family N-acetyltransferase [Xanthomonas citri pv. citri]